MKLIPCAPPRGPLNAAPLTDLVTPVMRQLESWDAFWGDDDAYYARLTGSDATARWFRVGPEAGTPAFGSPTIGAAPVSVTPVDALTPPVRTSAARGVVLYARVSRAAGLEGRQGKLAWSVATRGARVVRASGPLPATSHPELAR
ncbi:MAG TPA: hypothetical protein VEA99_01270 [Gemmatimonadaceae bacterium]|nr:hypothetical protein [Gemmatimonadaceae bacterium]